MTTKTFLSTMVIIFGMMSGVFMLVYLTEHNFFMWKLCVALELAHAWTISLAMCYSVEHWRSKKSTPTPKL
jgi:uncharacterized membrane protein